MRMKKRLTLAAVSLTAALGGVQAAGAIGPEPEPAPSSFSCIAEGGVIAITPVVPLSDPAYIQKGGPENPYSIDIVSDPVTAGRTHYSDPNYEVGDFYMFEGTKCAPGLIADIGLTPVTECEANAGTVTWADTDEIRYPIFRNTKPSSQNSPTAEYYHTNFELIGHSTTPGSFIDENPVIGARYRVGHGQYGTLNFCSPTGEASFGCSITNGSLTMTPKILSYPEFVDQFSEDGKTWERGHGLSTGTFTYELDEYSPENIYKYGQTVCGHNAPAAPATTTAVAPVETTTPVTPTTAAQASTTVPAIPSTTAPVASVSTTVAAVPVETSGELRNVETNWCVEPKNGSKSNGADLVQRSCDGSAEQQISLVDAGNGTFTMVFAHSGKCVDVPVGNRDRLMQYDCWETPNQTFEMTNQGQIQVQSTGECVAVRSNGRMGRVFEKPCNKAAFTTAWTHG